MCRLDLVNIVPFEIDIRKLKKNKKYHQNKSIQITVYEVQFKHTFYRTINLYMKCIFQISPAFIIYYFAKLMQRS